MLGSSLTRNNYHMTSIRKFAFLCFLLLCAAAPISHEPITGPARIIDGDTLQIAQTRIRLFAIDAPETKQSCRDDRGAVYACGERASAELRRHVGDARVTCEPINLDQYGRTVARCYADGEDLNRWMVATGWAVAYRQFSRDYVPAEEQAHAQRLGMWRGEFMLPSLWRRERR